MSDSLAPPSQRRRVAVVTGGGGGIGTAAARQLARQGIFVVAMDPGVGVQGEPLEEPTAEQTAKQIEAEGGTARASTVSVTDADAVRGLFAEIVEEFGSLDIVVNTAGFLRFSQLLGASEDDWRAVVGVHFGGYLNVLGAALPLMEQAGYGRIVGFTSGVGLARTIADGPAYGCAKRAVAALTWALGPLLPAKISLNALSPIAATRMVRDALVAGGASPKGLDLSAMPQAEDMAPAAAYLASEGFGWCRGHVVFSAGSELSAIAPPRLIEVVRTRDAADFGTALGTLVPVVLGPVEAEQRTSGGSNPRFGPVFDQTAAPNSSAPGGGNGPACLVVSDDAAVAAQVASALQGWGIRSLGVGAWQPFEPGAAEIPTGFAGAARLVERAAAAAGELAGVVVVLGAHDDVGPDAGQSWRGLLEAHAGVSDHIVTHAGWAHAAAAHAHATSRPLRTVAVTRATSPAGGSAAQAIAQLARCVNDTPSGAGLSAFAVSVETGKAADNGPLGALVGRLIAAGDTLALRGAELVVRPDWIGLRSHPGPVATVSFGGPAIPSWVDDALRQVLPTR